MASEALLLDLLFKIRFDVRIQIALRIFRRAALEEGKGNDHKFWVEGLHPILVAEEYMFREKLNYIHNNPVRKGYVDSPEHWLYSSARNYNLGDQSILEVKCLTS